MADSQSLLKKLKHSNIRNDWLEAVQNHRSKVSRGYTVRAMPESTEMMKTKKGWPTSSKGQPGWAHQNRQKGTHITLSNPVCFHNKHTLGRTAWATSNQEEEVYADLIYTPGHGECTTNITSERHLYKHWRTSWCYELNTYSHVPSVMKQLPRISNRTRSFSSFQFSVSSF